MNIATGTIFSSVHRVRYSCLPEDASTGMPMSSAISTSESASDAVPSEVVASDSLYSASLSIRIPSPPSSRMRSAATENGINNNTLVVHGSPKSPHIPHTSRRLCHLPGYKIGRRRSSNSGQFDVHDRREGG